MDDLKQSTDHDLKYLFITQSQTLRIIKNTLPTLSHPPHSLPEHAGCATQSLTMTYHGSTSLYQMSKEKNKGNYPIINFVLKRNLNLIDTVRPAATCLQELSD